MVRASSSNADRPELDVELALVGTPGVLALLSPAGLLLDRLDVRVREQRLRDPASDPQHLAERHAGPRRHLEHPR
jgi:hypothetical protein